ncbi:MAG: GTP-binding signal recognition particle G-domain [Candidatus Solibacter sp.]|nr:GTP-binding signal recognition particle G-domain [Candidatus Solibacter sp.]
MKIKSYYARTVEDALAAARQEMGEEAMLVNSRKTPLEARHLGEYEVVFATVGPVGAATEASLTLPGESKMIPTAPPPDRLSMEVAELKKELEGMRRAITRTACAPAQWVGVSQDVSDAYATLTGAEISAELAREVVQAAGDRLQGQRLPLGRAPQRMDGAAFGRALVEELSSRFTADATLGRGPGQPKIVALVGPPGCGKTTTLVKLAVNYGLAARRPVLLLSMDTYRVAAADQLRSYAAILGVGFQVLDTVTSLAQAIEENRGKELIFIDTPGLGYGELEDSASLGHFLSTRGDIDTHLVLSASMKPADLSRMVDAFGILRPQHLLFTKLDETASYGPILSEAARTGKPLSFFTSGQRIPEDLEVASKERVLDLVLAVRGVQARSAA